MTCISPAQRELHIASELVAVAIGAPFLIWVAMQRELPTWARGTAAIFATGTLLIDGYLLARFVRSNSV